MNEWTNYENPLVKTWETLYYLLYLCFRLFISLYFFVCPGGFFWAILGQWRAQDGERGARGWKAWMLQQERGGWVIPPEPGVKSNIHAQRCRSLPMQCSIASAILMFGISDYFTRTWVIGSTCDKELTNTVFDAQFQNIKAFYHPQIKVLLSIVRANITVNSVACRWGWRRRAGWLRDQRQDLA